MTCSGDESNKRECRAAPPTSAHCVRDRARVGLRRMDADDLTAADVVNVKRISTVDNDVSVVHSFDELVQHAVNKTRGYHQPNRTWRPQLRDKTD